jgi:hypothetical protein
LVLWLPVPIFVLGLTFVFGLTLRLPPDEDWPDDPPLDDPPLIVELCASAAGAKASSVAMPNPAIRCTCFIRFPPACETVRLAG